MTLLTELVDFAERIDVEVAIVDVELINLEVINSKLVLKLKV